MRKRGTRWWFRLVITALALFSLSVGYAQSAGDGALNGQSGLVARPLYGAGEDLPQRVMGIGVSDQGDVYVTETVRQAREEISLLQSSYLHEVDMGLKTVEQKRDWIERNYSPRIAASQRMEDQDADGDVDLRDLVVRSERIHVLEDADGDGRFDRSRLFAEGFNDILTGVAHSVNPIGDAVYATIIPDLWKLEDTDGDGRADKRESVVHGFANHIGYGNHDLHSVIQGFDGKLYWSMGDRGLSVLTPSGKRISYPDTGSVVRCNPDGSGFEVYASGLRNSQCIDFDDYGNLFSVDHDADFQGERERLVYLMEGSDAGWRCYYQYRGATSVLRNVAKEHYNPWLAERMWEPFHKGQPAYLLPPIESSWNAPASFSFQPGLALGGEYASHFLVGCKGEIRAFEMVADGAWFRRTGGDPVVGGLTAQVLASTFAPDGSLYFTLWNPPAGGSPVWRLERPEASVEAAEVEGLLERGVGGETGSRLVAFLGHRDRRVRLAAQFELAKRGSSDLLEKALYNTEASLLARIHSLWGLGQLGFRGREAMRWIASAPEAELRAQLARWIGDQAYDPDGLVLELLADPSPRVRMLAAIAAGKLGSEGALRLLEKIVVEMGDEDLALRHAAMQGLAGVASLAELATYSRHPSEAMRIAAVVALRRQGAVAELGPFIDDGSWTVASEAARALYDEANPERFAAHPETFATLAETLLDDRPDPDVVRALATNRRIGTLDAVKRIGARAMASESGKALRLMALELLASWPEESSLDPVDGRHFPVSAFNGAVLEEGFLDEALALSEDSDPDIARAAIAVLGALPGKESLWTRAEAEAEREGENPLVRQAWLEWLWESNPRRFVPVGARALSSSEPPVRRAASRLLLESTGGSEALGAYVVRVLTESRDELELQGVIRILGKLSDPLPLLERLLADLLEGKVSPVVQLDLLETAETLAVSSERVAAALERYREETDKRGPLAAYETALFGGDARRGESIFLRHPAAQCSKCHALNASDQQVGPSLEGIGKRNTREYFLESMVDPQAKIALGYGFQTVSLADGSNVSGMLVAETAESATLRLPDGTSRTFPLSETRSRTKPIGTMPDMKLILTKREIRDLVAYLTTL